MNEQTKQITFDIPEGYDIDIEHSDLKTGVIKLKPIKKQLPKTWDEFCDTHPITFDEYFLSYGSAIKKYPGGGARDTKKDKNVGTKQTCEAVLALMQLIQLRDCYNEDWVPNWWDLETKYVLYYYCRKIKKDTSIRTQTVLAFKTEKLRDQFLENFSELIEKTKPLI